MSTVAALLLSGIPPALGIVIGAVLDRRLDVIGVVVLAGLAVGTIAGLVSNNARLYLLEGTGPLAGLRRGLPDLAAVGQAADLPVRGPAPRPEVPQGTRRSPMPGATPVFRRAFHVITLAWGVAYLIEVAVRLVVVEITSTGIALVFSKVVPYAVRRLPGRLDGGLRRARAAQGGAAAPPPRIPAPRVPRRCRASEPPRLYTRPVPRTLVVTNDFPPRQGGIQSFVHGLVTRLPPGTVVVYAPAWEGAAEFDAQQPFPVIRHPTSLMLPVPSVSRRAAAIAREHGCDSVLFGAAAPLGLITPALRRAGVRRCGRPDARSRGRLGRAAGRPRPAAPHRRRGRRDDLPGRVRPGPAGPRAVARGGHAAWCG